MFKTLNDKLISLMIKTDFGMPRVVEAFLMLLSFWWAFILLLPTDTFALSQTYQPMLLIMGEVWWGMYFGFLGCVLLYGLKYKEKKWVMVGLMISTVTWLFVGSLMLVGSLMTTGTGTYLLVSLLSASVYFYKGVRE